MTVAGLLADIVGVLILAWDTLPEYRIYRWRSLNKLVHRPTTYLISELWHYRNEPGDALADLSFEMRYLSSIKSLRHTVSLPSFDARAPTDLLPQLLERSQTEVTQAIDEAEAKLRERWRPPLRLGLALIVIGFLLQLIGQLGSMHILQAAPL